MNIHAGWFRIPFGKCSQTDTVVCRKIDRVSRPTTLVKVTGKMWIISPPPREKLPKGLDPRLPPTKRIHCLISDRFRVEYWNDRIEEDRRIISRLLYKMGLPNFTKKKCLNYVLPLNDSHRFYVILERRVAWRKCPFTPCVGYSSFFFSIQSNYLRK